MGLFPNLWQSICKMTSHSIKAVLSQVSKTRLFPKTACDLYVVLEIYTSLILSFMLTATWIRWWTPFLSNKLTFRPYQASHIANFKDFTAIEVRVSYHNFTVLDWTLHFWKRNLFTYKGFVWLSHTYFLLLLASLPSSLIASLVSISLWYFTRRLLIWDGLWPCSSFECIFTLIRLYKPQTTRFMSFALDSS